MYWTVVLFWVSWCFWKKFTCTRLFLCFPNELCYGQTEFPISFKPKVAKAKFIGIMQNKKKWYFEKWVGHHASFPPRRSVNSNFRISWTTLCWPTDHPSFKALTDFPRKLLIKVFAHHFALSYFHLNIIAIAYRQRERIWFKEIKRKNKP